MRSIKFSHKVVSDVSEMVSSYTSEMFAIRLIADSETKRIRYQNVWNGCTYNSRVAGREACAFLVGAALGWSVKTSQPMPPQMIFGLKRVQEAYRNHAQCRKEEEAGIQAGKFEGTNWIKDRPDLKLENRSAAWMPNRYVQSG